MTKPATNLKFCEARVREITDDLCSRFKEWHADLTPVGRSPIKLAETTNPNGLRKYAAQCTSKAASMMRDGNIPPHPQGADWERLIRSAALSRAQAFAYEWNQGADDRERQQLSKARAARERHEHEAALRIDNARIARLNKLIKDAAPAEKLLADLFAAYEAHLSAEEARQELKAIRSKAQDAARALAKPAPKIRDADEAPRATTELAHIFIASASRQ